MNIMLRSATIVTYVLIIVHSSPPLVASAFLPTLPRHNAIRTLLHVPPPTILPPLHSTTTQSPTTLKKNYRTVQRVEKFARLPVWPAWNGALLFFLSRVSPTLAARLEDAVGGRVCPNFFTPQKTSPFVMLVHHRHSFAPWDPLRLFQRTFFPEGFPSHPHRGFVTVTYILKGGFVHRDSLGVKQMYGAEKRHGGKHTQWLTTGRGLLHEEMFDIEADEGGFGGVSSQELYQLWLNVPAAEKLVAPKVELLGGGEETPTVVSEDGASRTVLICGEHAGREASVETLSSVGIFHVVVTAGGVWRHTVPESHRTGIVYVRRGSLTVAGSTNVEVHHTAYLNEGGEELVVEAGSDGADFMLLSGAPLNQPIAAQGSMVMNTDNEINQAYNDYIKGEMGKPWSEKLTDEEWKDHNQEFPALYKFREDTV